MFRSETDKRYVQLAISVLQWTTSITASSQLAQVKTQAADT